MEPQNPKKIKLFNFKEKFLKSPRGIVVLDFKIYYKAVVVKKW
jgi:hypothetical protein